jgi:hypothetical protein
VWVRFFYPALYTGAPNKLSGITHAGCYLRLPGGDALIVTVIKLWFSGDLMPISVCVVT